jgi:hypothetical protein
MHLKGLAGVLVMIAFLGGVGVLLHFEILGVTLAGLFCLGVIFTAYREIGGFEEEGVEAPRVEESHPVARWGEKGP